VPAITLSNPSRVIVSSIRYYYPVGVEAASRFANRFTSILMFVNALADLGCKVRADTAT
jgi:hypothetical protein